MTTQTPPERAPRPEANGSSPHENAGADDSPGEAFRDAAKRFGEIREYIGYYIAVRADAMKLVLRNGIFYGALGIMGLVAAGAAVAMAVVLLLLGIARGLGDALGGREWLGDLIVGIFILGALAIGARIGISMVIGVSRKKTVEKYDSRKRDQRNRFGHDINSGPIPEVGKSSAPTLTEAQFLEQQAEQARAAIAGAFADLKTDLAKGTDPRAWMKTHPWLTLASVAVAGFAAAAVVVPSKEQQSLSKLQRIERALNLRQKHEHNGNGAPEEKNAHGGLIGMLLHEVFAVLKPAIISLITAYVIPPKEEPRPAETPENSV